MRLLKVAAITAALVVIPVVAVAAAPSGPTFSCEPWSTLPKQARVVEVTPTSVTWTNWSNTSAARIEKNKAGGVHQVGLPGGDPRDPIITAADLASHPQAAAASIGSGGSGLIVRHGSGADVKRLLVWSCS